jgi:Family of unknown function (DUF5762)
MNQNTSTIISNSYDKPTPPIIKKPTDSAIPSEPTKNTETNNKEIPDTVIAKIPFWTENPNVLFQPEYLLEFFPVNSMTYEQKLNAISRLIFVLTIISFMLTQNLRLLLIGAITLTAIFVVFFYHQKEKDKKDSKKVTDTKKEGFSGPALAYYVDNNLPIPSGVFTTPDSSNPFSNVLMTDYDYNPNKKPAPPAFNPEINSQIVEQTKQMVSDANPDQPDITDRLYKDLGEQLMFEQSLRPFNSNPATTIPNDQGAFADFCYGSMISCKEGNKFACARNMSHYTNY